MKLSILLLLVMFATCSLAENTKQKITPPEPTLKLRPSSEERIALVDKDGNVVATCAYIKNAPLLKRCLIEKGFTLDDVMNAWIYQLGQSLKDE